MGSSTGCDRNETCVTKSVFHSNVFQMFSPKTWIDVLGVKHIDDRAKERYRGGARRIRQVDGPAANYRHRPPTCLSSQFMTSANGPGPHDDSVYVSTSQSMRFETLVARLMVVNISRAGSCWGQSSC